MLETPMDCVHFVVRHLPWPTFDGSMILLRESAGFVLL